MNWEGAKKGIAFEQRIGKVFIARFKDWSKRGLSHKLGFHQTPS